jgi:NAD(P)-dependent dehydrogenase (short-subunit alcohol dehydrogenase family)
VARVKAILVTGGSRGIGRAVALRAGALGWSIAVGYREDRAAAEAVVASVAAAGGRAVALAGDVAVEADVVEIFDGAEAALGTLDGVVVNAGVVGPSLQLADMGIERLRRTIDVNVVGTLLCAREAARRLAVSRGGTGGSIVLVSSAAARLGSPNEYVDYAASKGAVDTLCLGLARELAADGVRVNAVRPGVIETEIHATSGQPDRAQQLAPQIPFGRPGTAGEVAEAVVWLLGDAASYTTGALLDVAGGR